MKNRILISALLAMLAIEKAEAQTIHLDTVADMAYCNIAPITVGWLAAQPQVSRIYVHATSDNLVNHGAFHWFLKYPTAVDAQTTVWTTVLDGQVQMSSNSYTNWDDASKYLFRYVRDSLGLNITLIP